MKGNVTIRESEPINKNAISNLLYSLKKEQLIRIIEEEWVITSS